MFLAGQELGAKAAYNTTKEEWDKSVLRDTDGKGVDIIIDCAYQVGYNVCSGNC